MEYYSGYKLHQIGPYIGKMRPSLARSLIIKYTNQNDWIWDPFCGSGTVCLEARLLNRNVVGGDINPYACMLTKAKLHAPNSVDESMRQLKSIANKLNQTDLADPMKIPNWVEHFYDEKTIHEILFILKQLTLRKQYFHIGCLLHLLHHQRPGFLSYPASHMVPYLRDKKYPRELYPELYKYRSVFPRLGSKIRRVLTNPPPRLTSKYRVYERSAKNNYLHKNSIDAVITSPPYMNALDYARDNRLRLWFLGVEDYHSVKNREIGKVSSFERDMLDVFRVISRTLKNGGTCILIIGDVNRTITGRYDVPKMLIDIIESELPEFMVEDTWAELLPDIKRSRREGRATRNESIIVLRRKDRRYLCLVR